MKSSGCCLVNEYGEVLLVLERWSPTGIKKFGLPKGRREKRDPDLLTTALRELKEETGIVLDDINPVSVHVSEYAKTFVFFVKKNDIKYIRQEKEITSIFWEPLPELKLKYTRNERRYNAPFRRFFESYLIKL